MNINEFVKLVIQSLYAIEKPYRQPYEKPYERILCYEFYHQFRKRMEVVGCPFVLHGELDKRYRNIKRVPDFVFHIPGTEKNVAVVQFKSTHSSSEEIKEDLRILQEFKAYPLRYKVGVSVIFGKVEELEQTKEKLSGISCDTRLLLIFYDIESGKVAFSSYIKLTSS